MRTRRILILALSALLALMLFPMNAFAGASLNIVASFDPDTLSGPGGVTYKYKVVNTGSATVNNIQVTADGTIIGTISALRSGETVSDHGYVKMGESDIGRNIRFIAKGYAQTSSGGMTGFASNTGPKASGGTAIVTAVCDTEIERANAVPVIGGGTQPVPTIGGGAQPVPTIGGGAQPVPTIGGGAQPVPTIGGGAQPVPVIGGGAQPVPVIGGGTTKVKASATVNRKVINPGDSCTVTVTARNSGTNNVSNVKIQIENAIYARSDFLGAGQSQTYRFEIPIKGPVSFQPILCYTGPDGTETAQGLEKFNITCPTHDLTLSVKASTTNPGPYEDVVFHITLTNNGYDVIQNLQLYDLDHQPIGGPLGALYPRQVVTANLETSIHLATNVVFYVDAIEGGGRISAQSNTIKIIPSIR